MCDNVWVCANKSLDQFEIPWYPSMGAAEVPETTSKLQMHVLAAVAGTGSSLAFGPHYIPSATTTTPLRNT